MKRYIKTSSSFGRITAQSWSNLMDKLCEQYNFNRGEAPTRPSKFIYLSDSSGSEYEIEVTRYFDGEYEIPDNWVNKIS